MAKRIDFSSDREKRQAAIVDLDYPIGKLYRANKNSGSEGMVVRVKIYRKNEKDEIFYVADCPNDTWGAKPITISELKTMWDEITEEYLNYLRRDIYAKAIQKETITYKIMRWLGYE